jgi:hypothetical protein
LKKSNLRQTQRDPTPQPSDASTDCRRALRISEVVVSTGLGRTTIYDAIRCGRLLARKCGRSTVILVADLEAFLISLPEARP